MKVYQGIDLVSVKRIEASIKRQGKTFLNRVFTPAEQKYCESHRHKYERYAARFAAKEALIKAIPRSKSLPLTDIEVRHYANGKPFISLNALVQKKLGLTKKSILELSLTHEKEYAMATVVWVKK